MSINELRIEAKKFGDITLFDQTYLRIETRGKVIEAAVIDGLQNTPACRYHEGVDVAIMRYSSESLGIPDGIYRMHVKAKAQITQPGRHLGDSYLYDVNGNQMHACHHGFDVTSVELPQNIAVHDVVIRVNNFEERRDSHTFNDHLEMTLDYCCTNGVCGACYGPACPPL